MNVLVLLVFASLAIATAFLAGFIWAVRSGQYEDTCTPSMRVLAEDSARAAASFLETPSGESSKREPVQANPRVVAPPSAGLNSRA